jgi:hypothetical protein
MADDEVNRLTNDLIGNMNNGIGIDENYINSSAYMLERHRMRQNLPREIPIPRERNNLENNAENPNIVNRREIEGGKKLKSLRKRKNKSKNKKNNKNKSKKHKKSRKH